MLSLAIDEEKVREFLYSTAKPEYVAKASQVATLEGPEAPAPSMTVAGTIIPIGSVFNTEARERVLPLRRGNRSVWISTEDFRRIGQRH